MNASRLAALNVSSSTGTAYVLDELRMQHPDLLPSDGRAVRVLHNFFPLDRGSVATPAWLRVVQNHSGPAFPRYHLEVSGFWGRQGIDPACLGSIRLA